MLLPTKSTLVPLHLQWPSLFDSRGLPRFRASVWASFLRADLAPTTVRKKLGHLESFYQYADHILDHGGLDNALADLDVDALSSALEGYFLTVRNRSSVTPASEERWQVAIKFVTDLAQRQTRNALTPAQLDGLNGRFMRTELLHSHLHLGKSRRPELVRSLPWEAVEALYELLDPESPTNPFRKGQSRWRIYILFILMLHQGLRRGEVLILPADVIKHGFDRSLQGERFWMTVKFNEYEDDPRFSKPSIKTASSIRQLPASPKIALLVQEYADSYRGRADHSFLINSQKNNPLSTEGVTKTFQKITASLPKSVRKILRDHTGEESFTPHGLRHTCAVVRLNQLLSEGVDMQDARSGFARTSDGPAPLICLCDMPVQSLNIALRRCGKTNSMNGLRY